ncbi:MAG: rhomboid family intramembrane serine protease [Candidatus Eremiobacteraeota bacterium]|nr:rhomboid family intramembrane serine protease [Candidatus Eremiobacteraeota bacterium]
MRFTLTGLLIGVNVLAFIWQKTTYGGVDYDHGYLSPQLALQYGEWWRVFTAAFLHGNETHLALNMLSLLWLGTPAEMVFGRVRFAVLYIIAIVGSGLAVVYFSSTWGIPALGASGAIYGLMGALGAVGLRLGTRGRALLMRILPVLVLNLGLSFAFPFISVAAHVGGLIAGFLAGLVLVMGRRAYAEQFAATFVPPPPPVAMPAGATRPGETIENAPEPETIEHPPDAGPHEEADAPPLHVRDPRE